ncbi:MAG: hypothetical protein EBT61_06145 [Verrucomicrobia bacterium]|nr:hypothetical protein [Verrucomicrobiota bacterium]
MSDTPPDRKEEAGAPEGPRNPWVGWLLCVTFALGLYVFSVGPVQWLILHGYLTEEAAIIWLPLQFLPDSAVEAIIRYLEWWR